MFWWRVNSLIVRDKTTKRESHIVMSGQFCTLAIFYNSIPLLSFSQQTSMKPNDICQIVSVALREKEAWKIKSATFPVRACKILEKKTKVLHCKSKKIQMNMAPKVQECKGTQIQKIWIYLTHPASTTCLSPYFLWLSTHNCYAAPLTNMLSTSWDCYLYLLLNK